MNKGVIIALGAAVLIGVVLIFSQKSTVVAPTATPNSLSPALYTGTGVSASAANPISSLLNNLFGVKAVGPVLAGTASGSPAITAGGVTSTGSFPTTPTTVSTQAINDQTELDALLNTPADNPSMITLTTDPLPESLTDDLSDPSTISYDDLGDLNLDDSSLDTSDVGDLQLLDQYGS